MRKRVSLHSYKPTLSSRRRWLLFFGPCVISCGVCAWGIAELQKHDSSPDQPTGKIIGSTVRGDVRPLRLRRGGFTYSCNECHDSFLASPERRELVAEHRDIQLNHGQNDYCLNCHHRTNRNAYVAHDGSEISSDKPMDLCAKCHGLIYRDWKSGAHGRSSGFWNEAQGERKRLVCIQCHDPHDPKFPSLAPMPGPNAGRHGLEPSKEN